MNKIIVDKKKFRFCLIIVNKNPPTPSPHIFAFFSVLVRPPGFIFAFLCVFLRACVCVLDLIPLAACGRDCSGVLPGIKKPGVNRVLAFYLFGPVD